LLLIVCLCFTACNKSTNNNSEWANIVLYNGNIITVDNKFNVHEAIAIKDGKIMYVGYNKVVKSLIGPHTLLLI